MKVYLDQSIVDEWLKFKSSEISFADYVRDANKTAKIASNLEAFSRIIDIHSIIFLYSSLNELESSEFRKKNI